MVTHSNILISILSAFVLASCIYGCKKMIFEKGFSLDLLFKNNNSSRKNYFYDLWKTIYKSRNKNNKRLLMAIIFTVFSFVLYLLFRNFIFSLFISICLAIFVLDILKSFKDKKRYLLHIQLIEFINNMIVMLRAGRTVRNIFKDSTKLVKNPLRSYLNELVKELELNFILDDALENFLKACRTSEVRLLVSALKINNKVGGDLVFILSNIVDTLQHSLKARSQIKTMTLQSRYSGNIISFFPIVVLVLLFIFMGDSIRMFFSSGPGTMLLLVGGSLDCRNCSDKKYFEAALELKI